ncbi:MAG: UDP-glucose dehydrogenase family protein [Thermoleophilaceae bacterium]
MSAEHRRLSGRSLAIIGAGYVGLVTAACLARMGHRVTLLEVSRPRLAALRAGRVPFHEPGLQALLDASLAAGRLSATDDPGAALLDRDAVLVCVGTPLNEDGEADLSQVRAACRAIAHHAPKATVVLRSTLPLGSSASLATWLRRHDLSGVVTNPEFLRQGTAVADFLAPSRIVIGTHDGRRNASAQLLERLYVGLDAPILVTDYASADMIKNAANAFLATKLSFINEIADLCEAYGADVERVVEGMGLDPRIGPTYLRPGIGFGGSCLPKELSNLMRLGRDRGLPVHLLHAASHDNGGRARRIADRLARLVDGVAGRRVAMLGLSFKPDTDDLRYSPALALAVALLERGARVIGHDPVVGAASTAHVAGLERADSVEAACRGAELVVLATEWDDYRQLDWRRLRMVVRRPLLFDGRNALDAPRLRAAGWEVARVGYRSEPLRPQPAGIRWPSAHAALLSAQGSRGARRSRQISPAPMNR